MCKVCTEAVHCVALCTRVTLGLGMCKICTEAVHCVSSPLQAFWRWSPLQTLFKFPFSAEGFKPPWNPLQAPLKPSEGEAPFRRWSPLFRRWSPLPKVKASSPLQAPLKPPWSPLQAPLKPSLPKVKPFWSLPKVKPPSSLREGYLQRVLRWRWSFFVTEGCPSWRSPEPSCMQMTPWDNLRNAGQSSQDRGLEHT